MSHWGMGRLKKEENNNEEISKYNSRRGSAIC